MKILLIILIVLAAFVAMLLLAALFIKKEYSIKREIIINKSKQVVFNYIRFLKNQEYFSKWVMTDPAMRKKLTGTDGTVGFIYAWDSDNKNAGKGEQEIIKLKEGERLDVEVRFEKPFANVAKTPFVLEALSENKTKITWGMEGTNKYPLNLMFAFMGGVLEKDLDISLNNLKVILEKEN